MRGDSERAWGEATSMTTPGGSVHVDPSEAEARARAIVNTALDAIITFDENGIVESFNPAAEPMFGCPAEEAIGRGINSFLPSFYMPIEGRNGSQPDLPSAAPGKAFRLGSETVAHRNDGSFFPAEIVVSEMHLGTRRIFTAFVRDITRRKRAEEALEAFTLRLARSNRELQDFASVAAHDLQEPLRKIQAFGDRLRAKYGDALPEDGKRYLDRMENAATRMRHLINDLLAFSRVTSRAQPFTRVPLEVVAREVVADLEAQIDSVKGRVVTGELPEIDADRTQMGQLLQNLIGNGLKFRAEKTPMVTVSGRLLDGESPNNLREGGTGRWCEIVVEDNGIGFDEKYLDRIFTIFQRLHGRHEYEGTGVGLAICRRIVERHGGTITARSRTGQGARFIVVLPARHANEEHTA